MADGKVLTGFSKPYVAVYSESQGTVTYSNGRLLARGVEVAITPDSGGDDNNFYADNVVAESVGAVFTGGELSLTVDGLFIEAEKLIMGLPTPTQFEVATGTNVDEYHYGDNIEQPYVAVGYIARYMSAGVTTYVPVILTKARFNQIEETAKTQEQDIDWQTQALTAKLHRDDTANHDWKLKYEDQTTEAEAEAIIKAKLNISAT